MTGSHRRHRSRCSTGSNGWALTGRNTGTLTRAGGRRLKRNRGRSIAG